MDLTPTSTNISVDRVIAYEALKRIFERHTDTPGEESLEQWLAIQFLKTEEGYSEHEAKEIIDTFAITAKQDGTTHILDVDEEPLPDDTPPETELSLDPDILRFLENDSMSSRRSYRLLKAAITRDVGTFTTEIGRAVIEETAATSKDTLSPILDAEDWSAPEQLVDSTKEFSKDLQSFFDPSESTAQPNADETIHLSKETLADDTPVWTAIYDGREVSATTRLGALIALTEELDETDTPEENMEN